MRRPAGFTTMVRERSVSPIDIRLDGESALSRSDDIEWRHIGWRGMVVVGGGEYRCVAEAMRHCRLVMFRLPVVARGVRQVCPAKRAFMCLSVLTGRQRRRALGPSGGFAYPRYGWSDIVGWYRESGNSRALAHTREAVRTGPGGRNLVGGCRGSTGTRCRWTKCGFFCGLFGHDCDSHSNVESRVNV